MGDFLALYHRDPFSMIWVEDLRPVWALMERLGMEPWSAWRAFDELKDPLFFGYTPAAARLDNVTDWSSRVWQATAAGNSKKRVSAPDLVTRPSEKETIAPPSLDGLGAFFASP